jgi:hypothetical protein
MRPVCPGTVERERSVDICVAWYEQSLFCAVDYSNGRLVATHRYNPDEGDWGFTRFCELRKLFSMPWEGRGVPLVQNDEANVTAYVRVVKDPTGVLWHSFQKYGTG